MTLETDTRPSRPTAAMLRQRRTAVAALVILAFVVVGGLVDALSNRHGGARPQSGGGLTALASRLQLRPPAPRTNEDRAIERVMRYTPYVSFGGSRRHEIALTFDDGPGPYTMRVARELRRLDVPATFFQVGQMLPVFPAAAREVRNHFPIGDHTLSHAPMGRLARPRQRTEIIEQAARMKMYGDRFPHMFRPPYASFNSGTLSLLREYRMLMVMWSIDSQDYTRPGARQIVRNVVRKARPGSIVLLHDAGGDRSQTIAALPAIVHKLRRRGYRFVTVPRMMLEDPPPERQRLPHAAGVG